MNVPFKFENTTREKAVPGSRKIIIVLSNLRPLYLFY